MTAPPGVTRQRTRDDRGGVKIEYATAITLDRTGLKPLCQDAVTPSDQERS
jgi:hypothetical protein